MVTVNRDSDCLLPHSRCYAFTLVEILIVVIIIGILAAIVLPGFTNATQLTREGTLKDELKFMRTQVTVYSMQHDDVPAGYPNGDPGVNANEPTFIAQMIMASDEFGDTAAVGTPGYDIGPYLHGMPTNPLNGKATVQIVQFGDPLPVAGDDSHGWIYVPGDLEFLADSAGTDNGGELYFNY